MLPPGLAASLRLTPEDQLGLPTASDPKGDWGIFKVCVNADASIRSVETITLTDALSRAGSSVRSSAGSIAP